jgi:hypothetical protein
MRSRPVSFSPEWVFLLLGLLAGGLLCVFVPFGAGFDEETHLVRVYDLAGLHLLPNRSADNGSYAPGEFFSLSYQRRAQLTPAQDLLRGAAFSRRADRDNPTLAQTRSIYPPPGLAVQAALARLIWLKYDLPVIPGTILLRLAGLAVYLCATWLAICWLPFGKWVLAVLALAPMALFAAATVNMDGFNNAVSFLFIALVLRIAIKKRPALTWPELTGVCGLIILLGLSKPGAVLILPLLLLFVWRASIPKWQAWVVILSCIAAVGLTVGWNSLALSGSHFDTGGEQSAGRQLDLILAAPLDFIATFILGNLTRLSGFYQDWVGVYGHWVGEVPAAIYFLFPLALAASILAEPSRLEFTSGRRLVTAGVFLLSAGATELLYFAANYLPGDPASLGRQGRYFTPLAPLLFLALTGLVLPREKLARAARSLSVILLAGVLALYGYGLYTTYYTFCGSVVFTGRACLQPMYKNLDPDTTPEILLAQDEPLTQSFTSVCGAITSVEVFIRSVQPMVDGGIRLTLLSPDPKGASDGVPLAVREVRFAEIQAGQYLRLEQPAGSPPADKFVLRIEQLPGTKEPGPGIGVAFRDEYPSGALFIAGNERGTDLIFRYSCVLTARSGSK